MRDELHRKFLIDNGNNTIFIAEIAQFTLIRHGRFQLQQLIKSPLSKRNRAIFDDRFMKTGNQCFGIDNAVSRPVIKVIRCLIPDHRINRIDRMLPVDFAIAAQRTAVFHIGINPVFQIIFDQGDGDSQFTAMISCFRFQLQLCLQTVFFDGGVGFFQAVLVDRLQNQTEMFVDRSGFIQYLFCRSNSVDIVILRQKVQHTVLFACTIFQQTDILESRIGTVFFFFSEKIIQELFQI